MATYRYIFADLLTNEVTVELPLGGVSYGRVLGKAGNFQGSFALGREGFRDIDTIDGTIPGRTALYIERNNALVWGGIIWSRTWQEQSRSLQFTGQTFESYANKVDVRSTLRYVNEDQRAIVSDLFTQMQSLPSRDIGIVVPTGYSGGTPRTVNFFDYEEWTFGKAIEYMANYDGGLDFTVDVRYGSDGEPEKVLLLDNVLGVPADISQLVLSYPGNIKNFWFPENASRAAITVKGIGAGEGSAMVRATVTDQAPLDGGYPELVEFYTNKDVSVAATLLSQTTRFLNQVTVPISVPTYELNPEIEPTFGSYQLGDYAKVEVESLRFPDGLNTTTRIIGWDVKPSSSESQEEVKIIVQGEGE